jgi:hypothetical protein
VLDLSELRIDYGNHIHYVVKAIEPPVLKWTRVISTGERGPRDVVQEP